MNILFIRRAGKSRVKGIPGPYRFFFYSFDCNEPEHVHVRQENKVCKLQRVASSLGPPRVLFGQGSLKWLEISQHRGDQFRHGGVNVHGPLDHRVRCLGVHDIQDGMDDLVASDAEDGCSQDFLRFSIHQNFHKPLSFAFLHRSADAGHGPCGHQRLLSRLLHLGFRPPHPPQWGIDVQGVGQDSIADAARVIIQQIGGYDFVVVVGGPAQSPPLYLKESFTLAR